MKYCQECEAFLAGDTCPTCGSRASRRQSIFANDDDRARRISTIQEEDPFNDDINRVFDSNS